MISLDTETTGLDLWHGARPYFVSTCDAKGVNTSWEWPVSPLARKVEADPADLVEIQETIDRTDLLVLQNSKFDFQALRLLFRDHGKDLRWDWGKVRDTLMAGHLLASNQPHDLTTMVLVYLGVNVQPYEDRLEEAVKEAKKVVKNYGGPDCFGWRLAKKGLSEMPSARESVWKYDGWLPRLLVRTAGDRATDGGVLSENAIIGGHPCDEGHPWLTVLSEYGNSDSTTTLYLYRRQKKLLVDRGLWKLYKERLKVLPVVAAMEDHGVTASGSRRRELRDRFSRESGRAGRRCLSIAEEYGHDLEMPKGGVNNSLRQFMLGTLKLPPIDWSKKTGEPSLDAKTLEHWEATLPPTGKPAAFVRALRGKRRRDTGVSYLDGYERFWMHYQPFRGDPGSCVVCHNPTNPPAATNLPCPDCRGWFVLHPSLNPTGTDTLRFSSSNPNEQNISKKEGFNLRYCFGPAPGREWWSMDYSNLELRIPAFEAGEKDAVYVFEHPLEPPYYGSYHLLVADLLHPREFKKHGKRFKQVYESTLYQWIKNGDFAVIYGAMESTADRTYHVKGAYDKIHRRFPKIAALGDRQVKFAQEKGYVETIPDRTVDPSRGYPLLCSRSNWGGISPTVPLNYHVQGTAMWCMMKAMIRCQAYLNEYNQPKRPEAGAYMVMQIHDEIVFDFPKSSVDPMSVRDWKTDKFQYLLTNNPQVRELRRLMEQSGDDVGVPTPVEVTYHPKNWSEGIVV